MDQIYSYGDLVFIQDVIEGMVCKCREQNRPLPYNAGDAEEMLDAYLAETHASIELVEWIDQHKDFVIQQIGFVVETET